MKLHQLLLVLALPMVLTANAQDKSYTDLSAKFNYILNANVKGSGYVIHSAPIALSIQDKSNGKIIQIINYTSGITFIDSYKDGGVARSYITGKNKDAPAPDNDYGNLVIADLNFDGKEDIALKFDSGGNRGPIYNFYIQQADGTFTKDDWLSNNMLYFPASINDKDKTLQAIAPIGNKGHINIVYQYNAAINKWKRGDHRFTAN